MKNIKIMKFSNLAWDPLPGIRMTPAVETHMLRVMPDRIGHRNDRPTRHSGAAEARSGTSTGNPAAWRIES